MWDGSPVSFGIQFYLKGSVGQRIIPYGTGAMCG
jgi:hypothetical protein